jgi:hypothetical protein
MVGVLQQSVCFFVMDRSQQWCNGWCVTTICVFLCNGQIVTETHRLLLHTNHYTTVTICPLQRNTHIVVTHQPLHPCYDLSITKKHTDCCNTPTITPLLPTICVFLYNEQITSGVMIGVIQKSACFFVMDRS